MMKKFMSTFFVGATILLIVGCQQVKTQTIERFSQIPSTFSPIVGQLLNTQSSYSPGIPYGYISSSLCSNGDAQGGLKDGAGDPAWGLGLGCSYRVTQTDVDNGYIKNVVKMIAGDSLTVLASKTLFLWMTGTEVSYQLAINIDNVDNVVSGEWKYGMMIYITNIGSRTMSNISASLKNLVMDCPSLSLATNQVIVCTGLYVVTAAEVAYAKVNGIIPFTTNITALDDVENSITSITSDYIRPLVILSSNPPTFSARGQLLSMSAIVFGDISSSISIVSSASSANGPLICRNVNEGVRNCNFTYLTTSDDLTNKKYLPFLTYVSYNDKVTRQYTQSNYLGYTNITRTTYVPYMRIIASSIKPGIPYVAGASVNLSCYVTNNGGTPVTFIPPTEYTCDTRTLNVGNSAICYATYTPTSTNLASGYAGLVTNINVAFVSQSQSSYGVLSIPYTTIAVFALKLDSLSLLSPNSSCINNVSTGTNVVSVYVVNSGATVATNLLIGIVKDSVTMLPSNVCGYTVNGFSRPKVIRCSFNTGQSANVSLVAVDSTTNIVQSLGTLFCN